MIVGEVAGHSLRGKKGRCVKVTVRGRSWRVKNEGSDAARNRLPEV
jgi:hypothetical protein